MTAPRQVATRTEVVPSSTEVDTQIATAKRYPRDVDVFLGTAVRYATMDAETAASCMYSLPKRDKNGKAIAITGPSVRLAEIIGSTYGNLRIQSSVVGRQGNTVTAKAVAWDLEANLACETEAVRRVYGSGQDAEQMAMQAAQAVARRNAIFQVVPRAYVMQAYEAAKKTATGGKGSRGTTERVQRALKAFVGIGVEPDRIFQRFGVDSADGITRENLADLIGIWNAYEGGQDIDAFFPDAQTPEPTAEEEAALDEMTEVRNDERSEE